MTGTFVVLTDGEKSVATMAEHRLEAELFLDEIDEWLTEEGFPKGIELDVVETDVLPEGTRLGSWPKYFKRAAMEEFLGAKPAEAESATGRKAKPPKPSKARKGYVTARIGNEAFTFETTYGDGQREIERLLRGAHPKGIGIALHSSLSAEQSGTYSDPAKFLDDVEAAYERREARKSWNW